VKLDFADGVWGGNEVLDMLDMTDDYDGRADLRIESRETKKPYPSHLLLAPSQGRLRSRRKQGDCVDEISAHSAASVPGVAEKQLLIVGFILS